MEMVAFRDASCQTDPAELQRLHSIKIKRCVDDILYAFLYRIKTYDPHNCGQMCRKLCKLIRDKAEVISNDSYSPGSMIRSAPHKLVINVFIGQDTDQNFQLAFKTLTDPNVDDSVTSIYRNKAVFAVVIVHGIQSGHMKNT